MIIDHENNQFPEQLEAHEPCEEEAKRLPPESLVVAAFKAGLGGREMPEAETP